MCAPYPTLTLAYTTGLGDRPTCDNHKTLSSDLLFTPRPQIKTSKHDAAVNFDV